VALNGNPPARQFSEAADEAACSSLLPTGSEDREGVSSIMFLEGLRRQALPR